MKKHGRKKKFYRIYFLIIALLTAVLLCGITAVVYLSGKQEATETSIPPVQHIVTETPTEPPTEPPQEEYFVNNYPVYPVKTESSERLPEEYTAKYALLMNADTNEITAYNNANAKMYPASLTKVMTLIVAVENMQNFSDTVLITDEMIYPMLELEAVCAGFLPGETPTVYDLLNGMIICSGAEASLAVAQYVAGSEEAFVELMNRKAEEMGLKNTHFTNVVGLHDTEHYSTATDMAVILKYALNNPICRRILSAREYRISPTEQHPDGLELKSNLFSLMNGNEMPGVTIQGGKTGFTDEAGNCIESFAEIDGATYILVLCRCPDKWQAVYDTFSIYSVYGAGGEKYPAEPE